jgi:hypothetical protein
VGSAAHLLLGDLDLDGSVQISRLLRKLVMHNVSDMGGVRHLCIVLLLLVDIIVLLKELLQTLTGAQIVLLETKDLKSLGLRHESAFDPEPFLSYLLPAFVSKFFTLAFHSFLHNVLHDFIVPLLHCEGSNHPLQTTLG